MARIEILAGLGTGKTSLANLLVNEGFIHVEEEFENNPFIKDFYAEGKNWLEFGTTIMLQHYNTMRRKSTDQTQNYVYDFSLILDRAYAEANHEMGFSNVDELKAYVAIEEVAQKQSPKPDLRIVLTCSSETQKKRILGRGREFESGVPLDFLQAMARNTARFIDEQGQGVKTLVIDTEKYDYVNNPQHKQAVLDLIMQALDRTPELKHKFSAKKSLRPPGM